MTERQRRHHNTIKRNLIDACAGSIHLDLACGRGGDIAKWKNQTTVHAIDIDADSIAEAQRRSKRYHREDICFSVVDTLGHVPLWPNCHDVYDSIACMFALHFFFWSEPSARMVLSDVVRLLKPGGVFFGIVPDGRYLETIMGAQKEYASSALTIRRIDDAPSFPFGTAIHVVMPTFVSTEYLVYKSVLKQLAEACGLQHVMYEPMPTVQTMTPEERTATQQYIQFVFRKPWKQLDEIKT